MLSEGLCDKFRFTIKDRGSLSTRSLNEPRFLSNFLIGLRGRVHSAKRVYNW